MSAVNGKRVLRFPSDFQQTAGLWAPRERSTPFEYSDGSAHERYLLDVLRGASDRSSSSRELEDRIRDWPSRYHLSPKRANLLRPLDFAPNSRILEIGGGSGPLARFLAESGHSVVLVEGSETRAAAAAVRCADLPVNVVVGNILEIEAEESFDAVILCGVLEYAAIYSDSTDPHVELLRHAARQMKPDGHMVLAIENRLGLKYLLGVPEDHIGTAYTGVENGYARRGVRTFTLQELHGLIKDADLEVQRTLNPLPDYKCVTAVVDFEATPNDARQSVAALVGRALGVDPQLTRPNKVVHEQIAASVVLEGLGAELAPSFVVLATKAPTAYPLTDPDCFGWIYAVDRPHGFQKVTTLIADQSGMRSEHAWLYPNEEHSSNNLEQSLTTDEFATGPVLWSKLVAVLAQEGWTSEALAAQVRPLWNWLVTQSETDGTVPGDCLDVTPFNSTFESSITTFDREWVWRAPCLASWVMLRGILFSFSHLSAVRVPASGTPTRLLDLSLSVLESLGVDLNSTELQRFHEWLVLMQSEANGRTEEFFNEWLRDYYAESLPIQEAPRQQPNFDD